MILISQIRIPINEPYENAIQQGIYTLKIPQNKIKMADLSKVSIDARHGQISLVCTVAVSCDEDEQKLVKKLNKPNIRYSDSFSLEITDRSHLSKTRPVVVGFGPAGMFCSLVLAQSGLRPIVLERGTDIDTRIKDVDKFWTSGNLNSNSNVQFGEGGAGTFSDGKLVTRIGNPLCNFVLDQFVKHGAPQEILYKAKPHVGTDLLINIVKSIREKIIELGGEIRFESQALDFGITNGKITSVITKDEEIFSDTVILAVGHSARDTFEKIFENQLEIIPKAFSVGVRIEHLQEEINRGLYGKNVGHPALPQGEYQLSYKQPDGRAAYTFCMCPGGQVVPSSSEHNGVVVNGMSLHARDGKNANCGLVVSVSPSDFGNGVLDGIKFQQHLEHLAYKSGGSNYKAPAQTLGNFLDGKNGLNLGKVIPSYSLGVESADFNKILPSYVTNTMKKGLESFDKKIRGFGAKDAVLTGIETRTSSPIRIMRNDNFCSTKVSGLYPCGEGAGYAGGIMSAAVDGIKVAISILDKL